MSKPRCGGMRGWREREGGGGGGAKRRHHLHTCTPTPTRLAGLAHLPASPLVAAAPHERRQWRRTRVTASTGARACVCARRGPPSPPFWRLPLGPHRDGLKAAPATLARTTRAVPVVMYACGCRFSMRACVVACRRRGRRAGRRHQDLNRGRGGLVSPHPCPLRALRLSQSLHSMIVQHLGALGVRCRPQAARETRGGRWHHQASDLVWGPPRPSCGPRWTIPSRRHTPTGPTGRRMPCFTQGAARL